MKKIWSLLLIVFALCGCVGTPTQANKKFSNVQQENFDNMLARNKDKSYRLGNLKSATLLKSQSVAAQTAKNAIFLVWTDFLPCVG
jgi:ABC-type uncharacterized transport system auxiliary subunit